MDIKKKWGLFLFFNLMLWSVVPLLRLSLPMDTQEAIVWGKYSLLGTTKHPPFSGIIAYYFYSQAKNNRRSSATATEKSH